VNDRAKLLDRVQKLLAMAKHSASNENEASIALRRAESMMRKHDIQYAELTAQTINKDDMVAAETGESRNSSWVWNAGVVSLLSHKHVADQAKQRDKVLRHA